MTDSPTPPPFDAPSKQEPISGQPAPAFSPGPPLHGTEQGQGQGQGGPRRRNRGGRNRNRGGGGGQGNQGQPPVRYEDEGEDPWAAEQRAVHEAAEDAGGAVQEEPRVHHDKIELPEAFEKLGLEAALLHAL